MSQKRHTMHGRDHATSGADPIPGLGGIKITDGITTVDPASKLTIGSGLSLTNPTAGEAALTAQVAIGAGILPAHQPGFWYSTPFSWPNGNASAPSGNVQAMPFIVPVTRTYDRIGVYCTSPQTGANYRLGVYTNNNGYPGSRLLESGLITMTPGGEKSVAISLTLNAGLYWLAGVSQASGVNPGVYGHVVSWIYHTSQTLSQLGGSSAGGGAAYLLTGLTSGPLPDPFTAFVGWVTSAITMRIYLRAA